MRVLIICGPLAFGKGGMERVAAELSNHLTAKSHQVAVSYIIRESDEPAYDVHEDVKRIGWDRSTENLNSLSERYIDFAPDVTIIFHASAQVLMFLRAIARLETAIILHEGSNPHRILTQNWSSFRNISLSEAKWEREVVTSKVANVRVTMPSYRASFPEYLRDRVVAFPNAIRPAKQMSDVSTANNDGRYTILNIGGSKSNKNLLPLIEAFGELTSDFPQWDLKVFSPEFDNPAEHRYRNSLRDAVEQRNIGDRVFFMPEKEEIYDEYAASHIHAITSLSEGLPTCVAEAMVHGLPSIGFRSCYGVNELIVHEKNGLLCDAYPETDDLKDQLARMMTDHDFRKKLGHQAGRDARQFEPKKVFKRWEELIEQAFVSQQARKTPKTMLDRHLDRSARLLLS